ncbi:unnamed protein product [Urochloa humidicola]
MDMFGTLPVRFYYNGEFIHDGKKLHYCGGNEAMSYINRDKMSLPEIVGHLKDHCMVVDGTLLHWLLPGKDLTTGLRAIADDNTCLEIANRTEEGCVADIYVEAPAVQGMSDDEGVASDDGDEDSDYEDEFAAEMEDQEVQDEVDVAIGQELIAREPREKVEKQIELLKAFYSPNKGKGKVGQVCASGDADAANNEISSSDSDYLLGDSCTSEDSFQSLPCLRP